MSNSYGSTQEERLDKQGDQPETTRTAREKILMATPREQKSGRIVARSARASKVVQDY